jgi:hypothetical protein
LHENNLAVVCLKFCERVQQSFRIEEKTAFFMFFEDGRFGLEDGTCEINSIVENVPSHYIGKCLEICIVPYNGG